MEHVEKIEKERSRLAGELSRANETVNNQKKIITPLETREAAQREELETTYKKIAKLEDELNTLLFNRT